VEAATLVEELKRRRVFRALIGYGIAAFAVLQIVEPVMHAVHWPDVVLTYVVVALAVGFPIVVSLAWIFDVNQGRLERTTRTPGGLAGMRLAPLLVAIGALAATPGMLWYFAVRGIARRPVPPAAQSSPSIAVLPFADLSPGGDQAYFSDGIAEEILNALSHVQGLRVIGRTSSFSFKGRNEDLRAIGEKLDASNLLEGSVRKSGSRVRITAQLIEAAGGSHLWSQEFDRELTDVFAVQDEIAKAVVAALRVKLLPAQAAIEEQRTASPEAHDDYLLGRHFYERGSGEGYGRAVEALERAVALDPQYAPAWAALSRAHFFAYDKAPTKHPPEQEIPKARAAAEKAIALAPDLAAGYSARALLRMNRDFDWTGTRADAERAISLNPGDTDALLVDGWLLSALGRLPEAMVAVRKVITLDPLSAAAWSQLSAYYLGTGEFGLAEEAAKRASDLAPAEATAPRNLGFACLLQGRLAEAQAAFQRSTSETFRLMGNALVEYQLGHDAEAQRALSELVASPFAIPDSYQIAQVYAWRGEADGAFRWLESAYRHHDGGLGYLKYDPLLRKVRGDPRYAALLERLKLPLD
jgi:serine/threonine-protein kinase